MSKNDRKGVDDCSESSHVDGLETVALRQRQEADLEGPKLHFNWKHKRFYTFIRK